MTRGQSLSPSLDCPLTLGGVLSHWIETLALPVVDTLATPVTDTLATPVTVTGLTV